MQIFLSVEICSTLLVRVLKIQRNFIKSFAARFKKQPDTFDFEDDEQHQDEETPDDER